MTERQRGLENCPSGETLYEGALIWDMVLPFVDAGPSGSALLKRFARSGHDFVSLTVAGDHDSFTGAVEKLAKVRTLARNENEFLFVEKVEDIVSAKAQGKLALGVHLEGTNCMERRIDLVQVFYDLGIRQCIPAFNLNNSVAGGCADRMDPGLSRFGERLIDEMQNTGILVDLSHTGYRSSMEAMERARRPMIFSHSNAKTLAPHYRNLEDDQIAACAKTGGVIGISGASIYLGDPAASAETFLRHVDHIVEIAGPEHVGLGTDYVEDTEDLARYILGNADEWPDGLGLPDRMPTYRPPEQLPELIDCMVRHGYDDALIRGLLGENFLRVCRDAWGPLTR